MKRRTILLLVFLTLYCSGQAGKNRFIKVYFPDGFSATAELAVSDEERAQGLMFREKINEDQAMLFLFEEEDIHSFWMKNMRFAIDILWLDGRKRIVHIDTQPAEVDAAYQPEVELVGDIDGALRCLLEAVLPHFERELSYYRIKRITTETTYDISRTIAELGYRPDDDFERQFAEVVDWYLKERRNGYLA